MLIWSVPDESVSTSAYYALISKDAVAWSKILTGHPVTTAIFSDWCTALWARPGPAAKPFDGSLVSTCDFGCVTSLMPLAGLPTLARYRVDQTVVLLAVFAVEDRATVLRQDVAVFAQGIWALGIAWLFSQMFSVHHFEISVISSVFFWKL